MPKPIRYERGWRVNFKSNGKRYRKRFSSWRRAQEYIEQVTAGEGLPLVASESIPNLIREYLRWSELIKKKSASTIRNYVQMLRVFRQWAESNKIQSPDELTVNQVRDFQAYYFENCPFYAKPNQRYERRSDGSATWNKYREALSAFFNWCVRREYMSENPIADPEFKIKTQKKPPRVLTKTEIKKLLGWFDKYDTSAEVPIGTFFRVLLYTGLRLSEATNLKWADVSIKRATITVTESKTNEYRVVPIHPDLRPYLNKLPTKQNVYIFDDGNDGKIYNDGHYWKILRRATQQTKIKPARVHDFRHTTAAHLCMSGIDIRTVQKILGHKDIRTTLKYGDLFPEHLQKAISRLRF